MKSSIRYLGLAATSLLATAAAQSTIATCSPSQPCPAETPCCSAYGQCGVGAYCLGGCDPSSSHALDSCVAQPTCKSATYKFNDLNNIAPNTRYLGNTTGIDWVSEGTPVQYTDGDGASVMLTMAPDTVGTLLSSTHYVWYGKMTAKMKSSAGAGVVSAFIMMSDVKDEIDFEFVGANLQDVQSNFYWQGFLNYTNSANLSATNTDTQVHTYEIDWSQDKLTWSVDGQMLRSLNKADTFNASTNTYMYPQTPSRVMLSLWPAGLAKNGKGTVDWAGGLIDWNSPYMTNGYYHAQVYEVDVQCYPVPSEAKQSGTNSYRYTDKAGLEQDIALLGDTDVLASFLASGQNLDYNPNAPKSSAGASATTSIPAPTGDVQTVPGVVGAGSRGTDSTSNQNTNPDGSSGSSSLSGSSGASSINVGGGDGSFSQGLTSTDNKTSGASSSNDKAVKGSVLAILIAFVALTVL